MQDGGFTLVREGDNVYSKKFKVTDGDATMVGISQEEGLRIYRQSLKRGQKIMGLDSDEEDLEREKMAKEENEDIPIKREEVEIPGLPKLYDDQKKSKTSEKKGMYAMQSKASKKEEIDNLRDNFEEYKRRLAKKLMKDQNRQKQLMKM